MNSQSSRFRSLFVFTSEEFQYTREDNSFFCLFAIAFINTNRNGSRVADTAEGK